MRFLWFAVVIGVAVALPATSQKTEELRQILSQPYTPNRNAAMENLIRNLLEDLRKVMLTGSGDVPVLDPLRVANLEVNDQILPIAGLRLNVNDLVMTKLATFVVNEVTVTRTSLLLQRYRVRFDGDVPVLDVTARAYSLFVSILGTDIFGTGAAEISFTQPRINANLLVAPRISLSGIYLNLLECNLQFSLRDLQPRISGLFGSEGVDAFFNQFFRNFVLNALDFYQNDINRFLSTTAHDFANDILRDLDLGSILG